MIDESLTRRFASKAPPILEMLRASTRYRRLESGEYLFYRGDQATHLYGVISGRLFITVGAPGTAKEAIVAILLPGQICGELAMIDGSPRSANARADGSTLIGAISRDNFLSHLSTNPDLS